MSIEIGNHVLVRYSGIKQTKDPAMKLDGQEFVVKRKKLIMVGRQPRYYWELYGAESEYGLPYGFCEEDLILL